MQNNDIAAAVIRLRELEQKATPGPWKHTKTCYDDLQGVRHDLVIGNMIMMAGWQSYHPNVNDDADFMTEARNLLPALLDAYEAQEREIERLRGALQGHADAGCVACRDMLTRPDVKALGGKAGGEE